MNTKVNQPIVIGYALLVGLAVFFSSSPTAWGHGGGGDIALFSTGNQVDVGFAILDPNDDIQLVFDPNEDVFLSVLLPVSPNPIVPWQFASSEPGFDADGGALPANAEISFNLLNLWHWDPNSSSSVSFSPADSSLSAGVAPQGENSLSNGGFHDHPFFGVASGSGSPAHGIYVGKLTVSVDGLADSAPYYMVSLVTEEVTSLADPNAQVAAAEEIGELVRLYAEDPNSNPVPMFGSTDFTFYADAVNHVRTSASVPEPTSLALIAALLLSTGGLRTRRS